MKISKYCTFLFLCIFSLCAFGQNKSPDMTVFGYTMGQPFSVPECKKEIKKDGSRRYYSYYKAYDSITCDCYQKLNLKFELVKKKEPMPDSQLHQDDTVSIYFKPTNIPKISHSDHFVAAIANSKLIEVVIFTQKSKADFVLDELTEKYGKNYSIKYYRSDFLTGGYKTYYIARWEFSDLLVIFQSDDIDGSRGGKTDFSIGEVTIRLIDPNIPKAPKGRGL